MATLVLGAVGTLVGGPLGGAIGSLIGNRIDRAVLAPKGRQGPRLGDLSVQTSSYGSPLPRLFGTMRVAGTVIWATDLREDRHSSGSAKAGGKTTTYSYSASFAVALSARPILGVGRIWADGNLLRGAAGDFKSETGFRLYLGGEDQAVDPLIAAAEGIDATPAHRGLAYAVFDAMQLAGFGNRIPLLTFEVTADAGDVAVADIAAALSDGALRGENGPALGGFAAGGDSVRGALEALTQACPMPLADDGTVLRIGAADVVEIDRTMLGSGSGTDDGRQPRAVRERQAAGTLPDAVAVAYYEPARDFQAGLQQARRDGIGRRLTRIDLPAAVPAGEAKALAERALTRAWAQRETATARVPWRCLATRAGTRARIDGMGAWRIARWSLDRMVLELGLVREEASAPAPGPVDAGRAVGGLDAAAGATVLALLDLPGFGDAAPAAPQVWLAAAGTGAGWRRAAASFSLDRGTSWQSAGQTALPATMGSAATILSDGPTTVIDGRASVEIELLNDGMALGGAEDGALFGTANLALLGREIIQFGVAEQLAARRFRLHHLLRGRRGTEWATTGHVLGERFVLLDPATLLALDVPLAAIGTTLAANAIGPGDDGVSATAELAVAGTAVRPPAPVHFAATRLPDGTMRLGWVRRSRLGWPWLDGGGVPLAESDERYRLTIAPSTGISRTVETSVPGYSYDAAAQAADGMSTAHSMVASVVQLGTAAASLPATITCIMGGGDT